VANKKDLIHFFTFMIEHHFQDYVVRLYNEYSYNPDSADNAMHYRKHHFGAHFREASTSQVGVKILKGDIEIDNCIILAAGGATTVHRSSTLIDNDRLVSCCGDSVFCFELPSLNLLWAVRADLATCFQIFKSENNYIIHGELLVTSLNENGQINWQFGGADIFVSGGDHEAFILDSDGIILTDFAGTKYRIDFAGQLLWRA
jgi:hypothetical protein